MFWMWNFKNENKFILEISIKNFEENVNNAETLNKKYMILKIEKKILKT